jgi:hypothetical protein
LHSRSALALPLPPPDGAGFFLESTRVRLAHHRTSRPTKTGLVLPPGQGAGAQGWCSSRHREEIALTSTRIDGACSTAILPRRTATISSPAALRARGPPACPETRAAHPATVRSHGTDVCLREGGFRVYVYAHSSISPPLRLRALPSSSRSTRPVQLPARLSPIRASQVRGLACSLSPVSDQSRHPIPSVVAAHAFM